MYSQVIDYTEYEPFKSFQAKVGISYFSPIFHSGTCLLDLILWPHLNSTLLPFCISLLLYYTAERQHVDKIFQSWVTEGLICVPIAE